MTQSGGGGGVGAENVFKFSVTLKNFQKSGGAEALPAPPPPRALKVKSLDCGTYKLNYYYVQLPISTLEF